MKNKSFRLFLAAVLALAVSACATLEPFLSAQVPAAPSPKTREPVVALVLGGGGVKGFAHVGVIKVLESHGIRPSIVVGTSAGSFVGALYASGMDAYTLQSVALGMQEADIRDLTLSSQGFLIGDKLQQYVNAQVKNKPIQQFPIRFAAVATDLESGEKVAFNYGNAGQAVRASCSIPNVFLPTKIGKRQFVDGGLVSPVPVLTALEMGADVVIAVDISAKPRTGAAALGWWGMLDQSINILSQKAIRAELARADVVIQPRVLHADALNLDQRHEFLLEGERVAQQLVPTIRAEILSSRERLITHSQPAARL